MHTRRNSVNARYCDEGVTLCALTFSLAGQFLKGLIYCFDGGFLFSVRGGFCGFADVPGSFSVVVDDQDEPDCEYREACECQCESYHGRVAEGLLIDEWEQCGFSDGDDCYDQAAYEEVYAHDHHEEG